MDAKRRPSGIEGLGDMSWGTHFCLFYEKREDLLDVLIPYFKVGLANHEFCLCVASEPVIAEEVKQALHETVPGFEQYLTDGQIEIVSHMNWYLKDGQFDPFRVRQGWLDKLEQAIARGYEGMRFAANISWLEQQDWNRFAEYEGKLDEVFHQSHIIGVCAYALERCLAAGTLDVVGHHKFTLIRRDGTWESLESAQLTSAREEVLKLNNELEQRVAERTAELASTNEQLKAEIVERMRVEEALRESEEKFSAAFRASPIGLVITTLDGKYVDVNQAFCDLLGYSREELLGRTAVEMGIFTEETRQAWVEAVEREGGVMTNVELSFRVRNGTSRTTLSSVETIILHGIPHRLSTVLDITERKGAEEMIRKSEQVLREAESLGHTGSWEQNLVTGEIFNTEENLRLFFGDEYSKGADLEDYSEVVHPDDREYVKQRRVQLLAEGGPRDIEYRVVWPDGSVHLIFGRATVVYNELGQAIRVYGTNVDITERKRAEDETKHHASRMEALAKISQALAEVGLDVQAVFETIVRHTAELIGDTCSIRLLSSDEQWLKSVTFHHPNPEVKALMRVLHPRTPTPANNSWLTPVLRTGQPLLIPIITQEQFRRSVQPEYLTFFEQVGLHSMLIVPLRVKGRVIGTLGLSRDQPGHPYTSDDQVLLQDLADRASLTIQNAQLFEQVQGAREQLGALSRRLLEVQESERRVLTTELHDRVGQNLTGLSIILQNIKALLSDETAQKLGAKFDDAQALVEDTTRQIRDIMAELHLPELEDYGLAAALETYAERVASRGNLKLITDLPDLAPPSLPSDVRIALFRAAQEAISNVLKHAGATQLEVSLEGRDGRICLKVEDDGTGFESEAASQKESPSWGLKIMRERIESIGGNVQIDSESGKGTQVIFEVERPS